jgi:hypothetical protein
MIRHKLSTFSHQKTHDARRQMPKMRRDNPAQTEEKPETHHNSPQIPKIVFFHSEVAQPISLTYTSPENPDHRSVLIRSSFLSVLSFLP